MKGCNGPRLAFHAVSELGIEGGRSMKAPSYGKRGGLNAFDRGSRMVSHAFGKPAFLTHGAKVSGGIALESGCERLATHMLTPYPLGPSKP